MSPKSSGGSCSLYGTFQGRKRPYAVVRFQAHRREKSAMKPLRPEDLQSGAVRAWATDVLAGTSQELTTKNGSVCQFFEPFECSGYKVQLRLDWKDIDKLGNPTLDADFYNLSTGIMNKSMKREPVHHTSAQIDGERTYLWEYADDLRKLRVTLIWLGSVNSELNLDDSCSIEVTREGKIIP